jgi:hypothetical protein
VTGKLTPFLSTREEDHGGDHAGDQGGDQGEDHGADRLNSIAMETEFGGNNGAGLLHVSQSSEKQSRKKSIKKSGLNKPANSDPKVTMSDLLTIDVDGIIDNDDEVSLETPVTIPENLEPDDFGKAVTDALKEVPNPTVVSDEDKSVRFCSKDAKTGDLSQSTSLPDKKPMAKPNTKSRRMPNLNRERDKSKIEKDLLMNGNRKSSSSDNLSESTTATNKTSNSSQHIRKGSRSRNGVPNNGAGVNGESKPPKRTNGVDASKKELDVKGNQDMQNHTQSDSQPITAPWDSREEKTSLTKNKSNKIDIDNLQKSLGKYYVTNSISKNHIFQPRMWRYSSLSFCLTTPRRTSCPGGWSGRLTTGRRRTSTGSRCSAPVGPLRIQVQPRRPQENKASQMLTSSFRC